MYFYLLIYSFIYSIHLLFIYLCNLFYSIMYFSCTVFQESNNQVSSGVLTRFCIVLGHVAMCQLVHLDIYVFSELKRRNNLRDEMEVEKKRKKKSKHSKKSPSSSASDTKVTFFSVFFKPLGCKKRFLG